MFSVVYCGLEIVMILGCLRTDLFQDEIGYRVADKIFDLTKYNEVCIDLGCGGGHIAPNIIKVYMQELLLFSCAAAFDEDDGGMFGRALNSFELSISFSILLRQFIMD